MRQPKTILKIDKKEVICMKTFENPKVEIINYVVEDIIAASSDLRENETEGGGGL